MGRFEKLCDQHQDRIFTFAWYFLGNREDAEEAAQEVLLRLWERGREVESDRLPAWITRVTRNICLDALRRRRSYRTVVGGVDDGQVLENAPAAGPDPAQLAEAADIRRQLERALQLLPESHRAVVVLREIQGMPYEEIGRALGLPLNTVKVYLHRGRRRLRHLLRKSGT